MIIFLELLIYDQTSECVINGHLKSRLYHRLINTLEAVKLNVYKLRALEIENARSFMNTLDFVNV